MGVATTPPGRSGSGDRERDLEYAVCEDSRDGRSGCLSGEVEGSVWCLDMSRRGVAEEWKLELNEEVEKDPVKRRNVSTVKLRGPRKDERRGQRWQFQSQGFKERLS